MMKMKVNRSLKIAGITTIVIAATGSNHAAKAATRVLLNGHPLATSVPPVQRNGRTLAPMRSIFEALGATVVWNGVRQTVTAQHGADRVWLQIRNRNARLNGQPVWLDQPAILYRGNTMVPLRFVSESLGAQVSWDGTQRLVQINTRGDAESYGNTYAGTRGGTYAREGTYGRAQAVAGVRTISVPTGAVVPVTLDTQLSSATARQGSTFTATVSSERLGDSEFPPGSKIQGIIAESRPRQGDNPGVLDLDFRNVILPDGRRVPIQGALISLDNDSVTSTTQGRIMAKNTSSSKSGKVKAIGIGAAAGFVLGRVLDKNELVTAVLGAAGGYLYDRSKNKNRASEAILAEGTKIGVRLTGPVAYSDVKYAQQRREYFRL
jgi:hypothetical protein